MKITIYLFFLCILSCSNQKVSKDTDTIKISDHYDGEHFFNNDGTEKIEKGFLDVLKWQLTSKKKEWPSWVDDNEKQVLGKSQVTFIGHATTLIQLTDINLLTDPIFSDRASPFSWIGPKRVRSPGISIDNLPPISVVLISHGHFDHFDEASIKALYAKNSELIYIVPLKQGEYLKGFGIPSQNIVELDWWEEHLLPNHQVKVIAVPAHHWTMRMPGSRNHALWSGFVVEDLKSGMKVYFAGDTGFSEKMFKDIGEKFPSLNLSLLPIGSYEPRWFMKEQHMNPEDAVKAHLLLGKGPALGIHFGTFQLSDEGIDDPILELSTQLKAYNLPQNSIVTLKNGGTIQLK